MHDIKNGQVAFEAGADTWRPVLTTPWYSTFARGRWFAVGASSGKHPTSIFVVDSEDRLCLVEVYRPALDRVCLETPRGFVDEGESPQEAAVREMREEAGIEVAQGDLIDLGFFHPDSGILQSEMQLFGARLDRPFEDACVDGREILGCRFVPIDVARQMIGCGLISDAMVIAAMMRFDAAQRQAPEAALGVEKEIEIVDETGEVVIGIRARRPDAAFKGYCQAFGPTDAAARWHWRFASAS